MTSSIPLLHAAAPPAVSLLPSAPAWSAAGRNLLAMLCAAVLALGLAGCGGGGGGGGTRSDPAEAQRAAITRAINAARTAVGALSGTATDAALGVAEDAVEAAKTAVADAGAVPDHEKEAYDTTIGLIEANLDTARASITAARGDHVTKLKAALETDAANRISVGAGAITVVHGAAPTMGGTIPGTPPTTVTDLETAVVAGSAVTAGGWAGGTYTAADDAAGTADEVVFYTDIEAPGTQPFTGEGGRYGTGDGIDSDGNLAIGAGTDATLIASSAFPTGPGIVTHEENSDGVVEVTGAFDGAPGTYVCTPAANDGCTSSIRSAGGIALAGGEGWKFVPDEGATVASRDTQYRYFGWWLRTDGDGSYAFGAFHGGEGDDAADFADLPRLQGTATYSGPAAGRFVIDPPVGAAEAGVFTAEATLEVDFGDVSAPGTVTGTVERFMVNGQSRNWSVELQSAAIAADGGIAADGTDTAHTAWSIGGEPGTPAGSPTWGGRFHEMDEMLVPTAATGTFEAVYGDFGRMAGAFGATRQP